MCEWKPLSEQPGKSGYVLLAITHHRIPMVVRGHYKSSADKFSEDVYNGRGVAITHWMPLPKHPYDK